MMNIRHPNQIVTRVLALVLLVAPLLIGLTLGSPFLQVAHAATWTVTDCGDTNAPGQLRTLLNAAGDGDTIIVPACTITLTPANGPLTVYSASAPKRITIVGAGAASTRISGGDATGVFVVGPWGFLRADAVESDGQQRQRHLRRWRYSERLGHAQRG
jgi:hypothetical protein